MRRFVVCALAVLIAPAAGLGQEAVREDTGRATLGSPLRVQPTPAADRDLEIDQLKAALQTLQNRVDQFAPNPRVLDVHDQPHELPADGSPSAWALNATWKNGLQIENPDEGFRVHVGGNLQGDAGWNSASQAVQFGPGGIGELQDGALIRRGTVRIDGTIYRHFDWVVEYDFANSVENDTGSSTQQIGSPSFINAWVGVNDLPVVGTIRAGWMKDPIGFEYLTSSSWLNFMERTPGTNSFLLRSPGIMVRNAAADERVTWAFDFHHVQNDNFGFGVGDGEYAETGRLTWLPWYEDDGRQLVHLGVGASHRHLDDNQVNLRGRPSVRSMPGSIEPVLADTTTIRGTTQDVLDVELAAVLGPWTIQSEYLCSYVHDAIFPNKPPPDGNPLGTLFYQSTYVEILYFLTGEYRAYDKRDATFARVVPLRDFNVWDEERGWGAWQVGVRYSYLDLQNHGVNGATLHDIVLGLNWFLNPNMKIQWNVALDHRDSTPPGSSGWTYVFGSRLAFDF